MRSVHLTVVSIVLLAFASQTVSALPVAPSHLAEGNVDAAAINGASSIDKRGLLGGLTRGLLGVGVAKQKDDAAKAAAKDPAKDTASSIQKRGGLLGGVPIVGGLLVGDKSSDAAAKPAAAKPAADKDAAKDSASSIQKRGGLLGGVPVVGDLLGGSKPKNNGNAAQAAGSTGPEEAEA